MTRMKKQADKKHFTEITTTRLTYQNDYIMYQKHALIQY